MPAAAHQTNRQAEQGLRPGGALSGSSIFRTMKKTQAFSRFQYISEVAAIAVVDIVSLLMSFQLAVFIRTFILPLVYPYFPPEFPFGSFMTTWWIFLVWLFFFYREGLYTERLSFWDEIKGVWKVTFFSTIGIFTIVSIGQLSGHISRTVVFLMGCVAFALLPLARILSKKILRSMGLFRRKVLIIGAGDTGKLVMRALKKEPNYGYEVIGFVDDDPLVVGTRIDGIKVRRGLDKVMNYLQRCAISDVFIALPGEDKEKLHDLINRLQHRVERILFVPDMHGIAVLGTSLQHFFQEQAIVLEVKNNLAKPLNVLVKRCFDVVVSILLLPLLFVPMLLIALLIRLDSKGSAIFVQKRVGQGGRTFRCYKFRTMYGDAEERLSELLEKDAGARTEFEQYWKLRDDPRITAIGRFLRETSFDELPQIFNVIRGEMSLVGPRPYLPREVREIGGQCEAILLTKPGITGLWQVSGRSNTSNSYRIALDSWYVKNWNLWLDIVILFKTVRVVLKREGAH